MFLTLLLTLFIFFIGGGARLGLGFANGGEAATPQPHRATLATLQELLHDPYL